ncbi:MAG: DUF2867 domain-containing protein [Chloroflexota bacterium]
MTLIQDHEVLGTYLKDVAHYDEKDIVGTVTLREFVANFLNYHPAWIAFLYRVRGQFVRLLGLQQISLSDKPALHAQTIPFEAGEMLGFFAVDVAKEGEFFVARGTDKHLTAYLIILCEPLAGGMNRFYVGTAVQYHNWAGPVYFNVIRPFHHIVVQMMMRAGVKDAQLVKATI